MFSNNDSNKFILLLRKGIYSFMYINRWDEFNDTTLPKKEHFCRALNMEDPNYNYAKRVCEDFEIKIFGKLS